MKNLKITIEGPQGSGKSFLAHLLAEMLKEHNVTGVAINDGGDVMGKIVPDCILIRTIQGPYNWAPDRISGEGYQPITDIIGPPPNGGSGVPDKI